MNEKSTELSSQLMFIKGTTKILEPKGDSKSIYLQIRTNDEGLYKKLKNPYQEKEFNKTTKQEEPTWFYIKEIYIQNNGANNSIYKGEDKLEVLNFLLNNEGRLLFDNLSFKSFLLSILKEKSIQNSIEVINELDSTIYQKYKPIVFPSSKEISSSAYDSLNDNKFINIFNEIKIEKEDCEISSKQKDMKIKKLDSLENLIKFLPKYEKKNFIIGENNQIISIEHKSITFLKEGEKAYTFNFQDKTTLHLKDKWEIKRNQELKEKLWFLHSQQNNPENHNCKIKLDYSKYETELEPSDNMESLIKFMEKEGSEIIEDEEIFKEIVEENKQKYWINYIDYYYIWLYTSNDFYRWLNLYLRQDWNKEDVTANDFIWKIIPELDFYKIKIKEALLKLPNYTRWKVYRIIPPETEGQYNTFKRKKEGDSYIEKGFFSTFETFSNLLQFCDMNDIDKNESIILEIESKSGKEISSFSEHEIESEILFLPWTTFKISKISNNKYYLLEL